MENIFTNKLFGHWLRWWWGNIHFKFCKLLFQIKCSFNFRLKPHLYLKWKLLETLLILMIMKKKCCEFPRQKSAQKSSVTFKQKYSVTPLIRSNEHTVLPPPPYPKFYEPKSFSNEINFSTEDLNQLKKIKSMKILVKPIWTCFLKPTFFKLLSHCDVVHLMLETPYLQYIHAKTGFVKSHFTNIFKHSNCNIILSCEFLLVSASGDMFGLFTSYFKVS